MLKHNRIEGAHIRIFQQIIRNFKKETGKSPGKPQKQRILSLGILPNLRIYEKTFKIQLKIKKSCDTMD